MAESGALEIQFMLCGAAISCPALKTRYLQLPSSSAAASAVAPPPPPPRH
ncbi:MAG: hypothetical protein H9847_05810 [Candidatus Anaerobiospirillum pullicola]|uniref:Uncharacterized protein n=1 Tax=Candidatus Anaerobiospirillum pullicola TaxID=2838451 RepID=A0A948TGA7_9GAMM|nr:hypothetical protein [Candidatus Anaerobiospirillum pullicola]